jgi:acylpyruvate hydrolase
LPTINHEVELAVVIGQGGKNIKDSEALEHILGYALGLDMTLTLDMERHSATLLKAFDTSCPLSEFIPKRLIADPDNVDLELRVNGEVRQQGNTRDMVANCSQIISYLSRFFTLERGDVILTGTPAGIGQVRAGDVIEASLGGHLASVRFQVASEL